MANAYGIQKVEETNVRTNKDIALSTGSMALQGAQMGSQFGPVGAGVGAIGMGAVGLIKSKSGKRKEERALEGEEARNEFVDNLEGRSLRNNYELNEQARYGMNAKEGMVGEIEKDEIVYEKDWNELYDDNGDEKPKDGGKEVTLPCE